MCFHPVGQDGGDTSFVELYPDREGEVAVGPEPSQSTARCLCHLAPVRALGRMVSFQVSVFPKVLLLLRLLVCPGPEYGCVFPIVWFEILILFHES